MSLRHLPGDLLKVKNSTAIWLPCEITLPGWDYDELYESISLKCVGQISPNEIGIITNIDKNLYKRKLLWALFPKRFGLVYYTEFFRLKRK